MELITDLKLLAGKRIQAALCDNDEYICLQFGDETMLIIKATQCYDDAEISVVSDATGLTAREQIIFGLMTELEYKEKIRVSRIEHSERVRVRELSELAKLKAKYES